MEEVGMETSDDHSLRGTETLTVTKVFICMFILALLAFFGIDHLGLNRFRVPTTYQQTVDLVDSNGDRGTFVQFDGIDELNKVVVVYARYLLNATPRSFKPFNFSAKYELTLKHAAEDMRVLHLRDKSVEMRANGTKFVKLVTIRDVDYDEVNIRITCHGLKNYLPKAQVDLFVMEDRFAARKKLCHAIFFTGSLIVLVIFLFRWYLPLSRAKIVLLLLLLSLISHHFWVNYGYPEVVEQVEVVTGCIFACITKMCYVSWGYFSSVVFALLLIELVVSARMDLSYLLHHADTPGSVELYVAVCIFQIGCICILYSRARNCRQMDGDTGFYGYLALTVNKLIVTIIYREKEPRSWFVLPLVASDLFVWVYAALTLDLGDPSRIDQYLETDHKHVGSPP